MTIGTALFAKLSTASFSRLQEGISGLQTQIAEGRNDPRPSEDTSRALRLSAADDLRSRIDRYAASAQSANARLAQTDTVLADVSAMTRQLKELALQSVNGTMSAEGALGLSAEAVRLRDALLVAANTRDALGQPLFSGYSPNEAFADTPEGVVFQGDGGRSTAKLSESLVLPTSLNGATVFGDGRSDGGLFGLVDDLIASLGLAGRGTTDSVTAGRQAELTLPAGREAGEFRFRLEGPSGAADLVVVASADQPGPLLDAVNAVAAQTGVTASLTPEGKVRLASADGITLSAGQRGDGARAYVAGLQPLDELGAATGAVRYLRPDSLTPDRIIAGFDGAVDALAGHRAETGALARVAERQTETLAARKLQAELSVTQLEEIDMAAAVTRLQTLLMTQEAAQQSFVRIRSTSLFDYLR